MTDSKGLPEKSIGPPIPPCTSCADQVFIGQLALRVVHDLQQVTDPGTGFRCEVNRDGSSQISRMTLS